MKLETLLLHSLFAACMLLCVAVMGAMLLQPAPALIAGAQAPSAHAVKAEG